MTRQLSNRRYYLHRKLRGKGHRYSSTGKTVFIAADQEVTDRSIIELRDRFRYNIQFEIPANDQ